MTGFSSDDKAAQFTLRVMKQWRRNLDNRRERRPSAAAYNAAFSAVYDTYKAEKSRTPPPAADGAVVEALTAYRKAQRAMRDKWADGDDNVKRDLWRNLHDCEAASDAALQSRPTPSGDAHG